MDQQPLHGQRRLQAEPAAETKFNLQFDSVWVGRILIFTCTRQPVIGGRNRAESGDAYIIRFGPIEMGGVAPIVDLARANFLLANA